MKLRLSASSLRRAELCPASASGLFTERLHADAVAGTVAHAVLEAETPAGERAEVAYALHAVSGEARELPRQAHRAYPDLGDGWICGTADRVRVESDRVVIIDHKTGVGFNVAPAAANMQLHFYAIAAASVYGKEAALVRVEYASGHVDEHLLDGMALLAAEDRIRRTYQRASAAEPAIVESDEACWRCPKFSRCEAKVALAMALAEGIDVRNFPTLELDDASVARGWAALAPLKKLLGEVERIYRGYAADHAVPLGNGKTLGEVTKQRESLDGVITHRVLSERYGPEVALQACEVEATKASVERAVKPLAEKGKGAALVRETLAAIAEQGGITTKTTQSVEEHT